MKNKGTDCGCENAIKMQQGQCWIEWACDKRIQPLTNLTALVLVLLSSPLQHIRLSRCIDF